MTADDEEEDWMGGIAGAPWATRGSVKLRRELHFSDRVLACFAERPATLHAMLAEAAATGDASQLESLLAADVVAYSDGGGVKLAALKPIIGADRVARFFAGLMRKQEASGGTSDFSLATINGAPGFIIYVDGELDLTLSIDVKGDRIAAFYMVRNPEKLRAVEQAAQPSALPSG